MADHYWDLFHPLIGYPFVCRYAFQDTRGDKDLLKLKVGDFGVVVAVSKDKEWIKVKDTRNRREGAVPFRKYIEVGTKFRFGDHQPRVHASVQVLGHCADRQLEVGHGGGIWGTTVYSYLRNAENATMQRRNKARIAAMKPRNLANIIINGTRAAGILDVINRPDFSVQDLVAAGKDIRGTFNEGTGKWSNPVHTPCMYGRFYDDYTDRPERSIGNYAGRSTDPAKRRTEHERTIRSKPGTRSGDRSLHYTIARLARKSKMIVLCELSQADIRTFAGTAAEQCFIALFGFYHPNVLVSRANRSLGIIVGDPETEADPDDELTGNGESRHFIDAKNMTDLADVACRETGWRIPTKRNSFGASLGLNWSSPFGDTDPTTLYWTKTSYSDRTVYRRPELPVHVDKRYGRALQTNPFSDLCIIVSHMNHKETPGLKDGTPVSTSFELMHKDKGNHAVPFNILPTIGPWTDWNESLQLACAIEWEDEQGGTHKRYVQRQLTLSYLDDRYPMSLKGYAENMAIIRYLTQTSYANPREWYIDHGIARIISVDWDNLRQCEVIAETINVEQIIPLPQRKGIRTLTREFRDAGLDVINPPRWPPDRKPTKDRRTNACDACTAQCDTGARSGVTSNNTWMNTNNFRLHNCGQVADGSHGITTQCNFCKTRGLPCTFTNFWGDRRAISALTFAAYHTSAVIDSTPARQDMIL